MNCTYRFEFIILPLHLPRHHCMESPSQSPPLFHPTYCFVRYCMPDPSPDDPEQFSIGTKHAPQGLHSQSPIKHNYDGLLLTSIKEP